MGVDMDDTYRKLARHLDDLPGGFPATESGVELRILRRMFTPEDAELALHVSLIPAEARIIARRAGLDRETAAQRLAVMARKGLIVAMSAGPAPVQYVAAQFVIGIWEFHLNDLDAELVRDVEEYMPTLFAQAWKFPQLRTIPVHRSLTPQLAVLPYESAGELVRRAQKLAVAPCICRRERKLMGSECHKIMEACLVFDMGADLFLRNGLGREINREEALDILARADKAGMVLQPGNSQEAMNICCCCGCCCGVLRGIKAYPRPAELVSSPFLATAKPGACKACGACVKRCQMDAIKLETDRVALDPGRCIGCGLCVSTCPSGTLALMRKPPAEQPAVPKGGIQSMIQLGKARGKITNTNLAWMVLKSKVERLITPR